MKKVFFTCIFLSTILVLISCAKQPKEIIKKSIERCKSIDCGSYEMSKELILFSDTTIMEQKCIFKKVQDSSTFPLLFNSTSKIISGAGKLEGEIHFLGTTDKIIWYMTENDSVAGFIPKHSIDVGRAKNLFQKNFVYGIYYPITYQDCYPLEELLNKSSDSIKFELKKEAIINGKQCYVVNSKSINSKGKEIECFLYINKEDYLILSLIITYKKFYDDTDITEKYDLIKYDFNQSFDDSEFIVPQHTQLIDRSEEYQ